MRTDDNHFIVDKGDWHVTYNIASQISLLAAIALADVPWVNFGYTVLHFVQQLPMRRKREKEER